MVRPPLFGLGMGPINPPGPVMVRMDRKDPNIRKTKQKPLVLSLSQKLLDVRLLKCACLSVVKRSEATVDKTEKSQRFGGAEMLLLISAAKDDPIKPQDW